jgi:surface antigen
MKIVTAKRLLIVGVAISLAGCNATMQQAGTVLGGVVGGVIGKASERWLPEKVDKRYAVIIGTALGAYVGNQIGRGLDERDKKQVAVARQRAFDSGAPQSWESPERKTRGSATVVSSRTEQTTVAVPVLRAKVSQVPPLEIIGATYKAKAASPVRGGPGTDFVQVGNLKANEAVNVVGQVKGSNWFLISQDGAGSGFVQSSMMEEAPDDVPASSGTVASANVVTQTVASERVCRTVEQSVSLADGSTRKETVEACKGPNGWVPRSA